MLCQQLRGLSQTLPIIFFTARDNDVDTISGLRMGADDYLTKDISMAHLLARIAALFRRTDLLAAPTEQKDELKVGDLKVYKLQDGQTYLRVYDLLDINQDEAKKLEGGTDAVCVPINSYLIKIPNQIVLDDAGAGIIADEDTGHLVEQLKEIVI